MNMRKSVFILAAVVTGFLFSGCGYNKMVSMDEAVGAAWA